MLSTRFDSFSRFVSPWAEAAEFHVRDWLRSCDLVRSVTAGRRFDATLAGGLAARVLHLGRHVQRPGDLARLRHTHRAITEILRLHTPNWILTRRAEEPLELGGFLIPAGGKLAFSLTTLHRDPSWYDNPLRFDPDRRTAARSEQLPRHAFIPFGVGKHKCIGDSFAWTEMCGAGRRSRAAGRIRPDPG
jgi:cytochrome P450